MREAYLIIGGGGGRRRKGGRFHNLSGMKREHRKDERKGNDEEEVGLRIRRRSRKEVGEFV